MQLQTDYEPGADIDLILLWRDGNILAAREVSAADRYDTPVVLAEISLPVGTRLELEVELKQRGAVRASRRFAGEISRGRVIPFVLHRSCETVTCPPSDRPAAGICADGVCVECELDEDCAAPAAECASALCNGGTCELSLDHEACGNGRRCSSTGCVFTAAILDGGLARHDAGMDASDPPDARAVSISEVGLIRLDH